jgi:membrane protein YqaA with SNARE-associated domain
VNKTGDPMDLLANTVGAIIGIVMGAVLFRFHQMRKQNREPVYIDYSVRPYSNRRARR